MYFQQSDILRGMSKAFVKSFMDLTTKESHKSGYQLFQEGNRANFFYILLRGRVKLTIGEEGHTVYTIDQPGEAFGWSSLVGRPHYSATAECREPTKLLKIQVKKLHQLFDDDPQSGRLFFMRLSATLGNRLLQTYKMISTLPQASISPSYGTGYAQESDVAIS